MKSQHFPLNTLFRPSPQMKAWFRGGIAFAIVIVLLFSWVPVVLFSNLPAIFSVVILDGTVLLYVQIWIWAGLYSESMWYTLRDDEITWRRGFWFRKTGIVPYNGLRTSTSGKDRSCGIWGSPISRSRPQVAPGRPSRRSGSKR